MKKIYLIAMCSIVATGAWAQWTTSASMNERRAEHVCVALPTGTVLVAGGWDAANSKTAEVYNPATDTWTLVGAMSNFHSTAAATLLANGNVLMVGGYNGTSNTGICELYDTTAKTWSTTGALANARSYHTATLLANGKVLVVGGYDGTSNLSACELYDPIAKTWSSAGALAAGRSYHTATLMASGKVMVAGGYNATSFQLNTTELYDPATNMWSAGALMTSVRSRHGASLLKDGKVMVSGGEFYNGGTTYAYNGLMSAEVYDPAAATWTAVASMPTGVCYNTQHTLPDGRVVVVAGLSQTNYSPAFTHTAGTTYLYTPSTNAWLALALNADGRLNFASALMANGKVVVTGNFADKSVEVLTSLPGLSIAGFAQQNGLSIYPNPTKGLLYMASKNNELIKQIAVTDVVGKAVAASIDGAGTHKVSVDMGGAANGLYFVRMEIGDRVESVKIFVEK